MNQIYVVRGTERAGPFTEAETRAQLASGELKNDSLVWWEGLAEWTPIARTPLAASAAVTPGAPLTVPPPVPAERTSSLAIASLILGCLGWLFPIVLGPAGVITGHLARAEIQRDPLLKGAGKATAGLILGYIWSSFILLAFISVVAISVLIALGNQVKGVYSTINSQLAAPGGSDR